jgi:hypothetical protein
VIVATLAAGVVGAAALPLTRVGIGWPICALAVLAVGLVARRHRPAHTGRDLTDLAWQVAAGLTGLVLISTAAWRAAGWLVAISAAAGVLLCSYALAGGRRWLDVVGGALAFIPATIRGLGWAAQGGRALSAATPGAGRGTQPAARALAGFAVGVVLLVVFGSLFRAADPAFSALVARWTSGISFTTVARASFAGLLLLLAGVAVAHLTSNPPTVAENTGPPVRPVLRVLEWAVPVAMLDALFATFVWVQVTVLFGGETYVLGPGGPDYAVYARGGFIELGFVTVLTLGVMALLAALAGRTSRLELGLLRLLGGALAALTLVVIASALTRLGLYADAYGFTIPRLLGYAGVVWLGLVFGLILAAGVQLRAPWLPRATVAAAAAVLVGLVAVNPEAIMARGVLARLETPYPVDYFYLSILSADAVDELDRLPEPGRSCLLEPIALDLAPDEPWYAWNLAREHARDVLQRRPRLPECRWPG